MASNRFKTALQKFMRRTEEEQWVYGTMGRKTPSNTYIFEVPGRAGFVYVMVRNSSGAQTPVAARNDADVEHSAGLPVKMRFEFGVHVIYGKTRRDDLGVVPPSPPTGVYPHTHAHAALTDHDASDDHTQYHNNARGDARYFTEAEHIDVSAGVGDAGKPIVLNASGEVDATMLPSLSDPVEDQILAADADDTLADTDIWGYVTGTTLVRTTWLVIKTTLTTLFDTLYAPIAKGVTNGDAHDHVGGDGAQINHTGLSNIGTNSHATIDSHIASTANPHNVTKTQVGLGNVDNTSDATKNAAAVTLTNKTLDSTNISTLTAKNPPVDADSFVIVDSAASNFFKRVTGTNVKAYLKTYFDGLYGLLSAQNIWTAFQTIEVDGSNSQLWLDTYRNSLNQGIILMRSARGTKASPLVSALNDDLGRWVAQGYSAAAGAFVNAAAIYMSVDGTPDSGGDTTDMPSRINIYTSPEGSATLTLAASFDSAQRLNVAGIIRALSAAGIRIEEDGGALGVFVEDSTGDVGIKTAAPTQALQVNSTSTNTAIAVSISDVIKGYIFAAGAAANGSNIAEANDFILRADSNNVIITARNATGDIIFATQSPDTQKAILTNAGLWGIGIAPTNLLSIRAGASTRAAAAGGDIFTDHTSRANSGTTETNLSTYTVPEDLLSVNGQYLEIHAWGNMVSNVNTKTLKLHWGSESWTLIVDSGSSGTSWAVDAIIMRTGAATQTVNIKTIWVSNNAGIVVAAATRTLSGTNVLKMTGQSSAASNDVTQRGMSVIWHDANP